MPELPEVETVARTLAPQVCGRRIAAVDVLNAGTWQGEAGAERVAAGRFVATGTGRRGKLLLLYLSREADVLPASHPETEIPAPESASCWPLCYTACGAERGRPSLDGKEPGDITALAFHLRMTGRLFVYPAGTPPEKHTRVIFTLDDGRLLFFDDTRKFGQVRALSTREMERWSFWRELGPEPLEMSDEAFAERFFFRAGGEGAAARSVRGGGRGQHLRRRESVPRRHPAGCAGKVAFGGTAGASAPGACGSAA